MTRPIEFKWEKLAAGDDGSGSWRVKVIGGWIFNNLTMINTHQDGTQRMATETSVFIPDPEHQWTIIND